MGRGLATSTTAFSDTHDPTMRSPHPDLPYAVAVALAILTALIVIARS